MMKLSWFIVPKEVEHINDYLFMDTYMLNKIKLGMNEMRVNDSEISVCNFKTRANNQFYLIPDKPRTTRYKKTFVVYALDNYQ